MCSQDTVRIPLRANDGSIRAYAIVDAADAAWVNQWCWNLAPNGYARRSESLKTHWVTFALHREILGLKHGDGVRGDHINHDRLDNRRSNLRAVTASGNAQNTSSRRGSTSVYRGVCWFKKTAKWKAYTYQGGKIVHLGYFTNEHEAGRVAREARLRVMPFATE